MVALSLVSVVDDAQKQTVKEENVSYVLHKSWVLEGVVKNASYYINTSQITCEDEHFSRRSLTRRRELKTSLQSRSEDGQRTCSPL